MINYLDKISEVLTVFFTKFLVTTTGLLAMFGLNGEPINNIALNIIDEAPQVEEVAIEEDIFLEEAEVTFTEKEDLKIEIESILSQSTIVDEIKLPVVSILPKISSEEVNTKTREALVNIFCTTKIGGSFKPITGSGIFIDDRGVILTNAHVAQYFLLENYQMEGFINCLARSGNPAKATYYVEPIYISPSWIKNNAGNLNEQNPKGTGEDDYAFLLVTGSIVQGLALPEKFPFVKWQVDQSEILTGTPLLVAGYPAGFLGGISIQKELWQVSSFAEIKELFYFEFPYNLDLFSIGGNIIAQKGSSGGVAVSLVNGYLTGLIVTSTLDGDTSERDMRAVTVSHVDRSLTKEKGEGIESFLDGDLNVLMDGFNNEEAPILRGLLVNELNK